MALTVVMMLAMCVTAFAASADALELPSELPTDSLDFISVIIDFIAGILRALGEIIGVIFQ